MSDYNEDNITTLSPLEHIRKVPGMYIGKLGDGKNPSDGIYVLLKEVIDNSIDEFRMKTGKQLEVELTDCENGTQQMRVKDWGRGIPLGSLQSCVSNMNTSGKFDTRAFQKSVGLHGVGTKAVNALTQKFEIQSVRDKQSRTITFALGVLQNDSNVSEWKDTKWKNGTETTFVPDPIKFGNYSYQTEYLERMFENYACLNPGLEIFFISAGEEPKRFFSERGLPDLLDLRIKEGGSEKELAYEPISLIHPDSPDIEIVFTHGDASGEEIYSFVNGQYTPQGGPHETAFREGIVKTLRNHFNRKFETPDVRSGIIAAISVRIQSPTFRGQTKSELGSEYTEPADEEGKPQGESLRVFFSNFLGNLDNYLHKNPEICQKLKSKLLRNEEERKEMAGIKDKAKDTIKKAKIQIEKLKDCKVHFNSTTKGQEETRLKTSLFITEGDGAGGSISQARDSQFQAVYPLKGKPENCFGLKRSFIYSKPELHLLVLAMGLEESIENLRYNNIIIATDADVDGMHIRMLMGCFFLQYFPELIREGHVYFLETPLYRVRNKKEEVYCYTEEDRDKAIKKLSPSPEITRFKGLGEITPKDFKAFIGDNMRLEPFRFDKESNVKEDLEFYLGKNTPERKEYVCANLQTEAAL